MKQEEEQFRKLKTFDFVEDTICDEKEQKKAEDLRGKYREKSIYERWMLYTTASAYDSLNELKKSVFEETQKYFQLKDTSEQEERSADIEIFKVVYDPDGEISNGKILGGSNLLQDIYKRLWPELTKQEFMRHSNTEEIWICSDTMTSVKQRMNDFLSIISCEKFKDEKEYIREKAGQTQQKYSEKLCIELYLKYGKEFEKKLDIMKKFLEHWHHLGNYCPVPVGFNGARSGLCAKYDYWDLTLQKIGEYYLNPNDAWKIIGEELLHGKGNALACKLWLDYFGSWEEFIKQNHMQDFVKDFEHGNYEVKPFFDGHNWDNKTPKELGEFKDLFERSSEMIEKRTERIVNALIAEYKQEQLLRGIMAKLS